MSYMESGRQKMAVSRRSSHRAIWLLTFLFTLIILLSTAQKIRSGLGATSDHKEKHFAVHRRQSNASIPVTSATTPTDPVTSPTAPPPTTSPTTPPSGTPVTSPATTPSNDPTTTQSSGSGSTPVTTPSNTPVDGNPAPSKSPNNPGSTNGAPPDSSTADGGDNSSAPAAGGAASTNAGAAASSSNSSPSVAGGSTPGKSATSKQPSSTPFTHTQAVTSLGKPVTLGSTTKTTDKATVVSSTGADGKVFVTTKHVIATIVTDSVSTPKQVYTTTSTGLGSASTGGQDSDNFHPKTGPTGMSGAAKAAVGVLVPLLVIAAAAGIAAYLYRKKKMQHGRLDDYDDEKHMHISPPMTATGTSDAKGGFAGLSIPSPSSSTNSKAFDAMLPSVQPRSPAVSIVPTGYPSTPPPAYPPGPPTAGEVTNLAAGAVPAAATTTGSGLMRSNSNVSSITTVSSTSRYSRTSRYSHYSTYSQDDGRGRTPSPPPPLPDMLPNGSRFLDPSLYNGSAHGSPAPSLNPFVDSRSNRTSTSSSGRLSSAYFFDSENAAAASMVRSGSTTENKRNSTYVIPYTRNGPLGEPLGGSPAGTLRVVNDEASRGVDASKRMSIVSDASSSASGRRYSSGEAAVTPGGRVVPPVPLMSNGATGPDVPGFEPHQGHSVGASDASFAATSRGNNSTSNAIKRRSSYSTAAPRLPQLVEEESSFGFSFEFSGSGTPADLSLRPQTSPESKKASTPNASPPRSRDGGTDASSISESVESGRMDGKGLRGRALSTGYRRYRPDNL